MDLLRRYSNLPDLDRLLRRVRRHLTEAPAGQPRSADTRPQRHKVTRRLSPEQITQLVADYDAGVASTELVVRYGLGKGTVLELLRAHGATLRHQPRSDSEIAEAVALYASGLSVVKVADRLDRPMSTVYLALKQAGVKFRQTPRR